MQQQILISISADEFQKRLDESVLKAIKSVMQEKEKPAKEIMTVKEVAEFLNKKESTIYSYTHFKKIPHYKKGKSLFFKRSEIEKWRDNGKQLTQEEFNALANLKLSS